MSAGTVGSVILWLIVLAIVVVISVYLLRWLYRRSTKETAFVRTGLGGEKVIISSGAFAVPVLHEITPVGMNVMRIEVSRRQMQGLITKDRMRVDVVADFFVRVGSTPEEVGRAAQTLGRRTVDPESARELFEGRFAAALRTAAAQMTLEDLHEMRQDYAERVKAAAAEGLAQNGLELESVAIVDLDQTSLEFFDSSNSFDAEGLTQLTEAIEARRRMRNEIEQRTQIEIRTQNLEAQRQALDIEREGEYARLAQEHDVEIRRAAQRVELAKDRAHREREVQRDRAIEIAEIESAIAIAKKSAERSAAIAAAEAARAQAIAAEEQAITTREREIAERRKTTELIAAGRDAEREAVRLTRKAEAEKEAAASLADAARITASGEAEAEKIKANAAAARYEVEARGAMQLNEAENTLSDPARLSRFRAKLLERIEGIVRESVRPMEKIEAIKILHIDGGAGASPGNRNVTDEVINSALRYRVQAPMIDSLMKEIGIEGGGLGRMTEVLRDAKDIASLTAKRAGGDREGPRSPDDDDRR